jgi:hypothetical protein
MEIPISNAEFISAIFPEDANVAVCSKKGDPNDGGWSACLFNKNSVLDTNSNNYVNCSSFNAHEDETFNVQKKNFDALHFILLDDLGTKIPLDRLGDFKPTWMIETSSGNFQAGIAFKVPITDIREAEGVQKSILDAGCGDRGAGGLSRWARLPNAVNGKEKYLDEDGKPFQCKLVEWHPDVLYSIEELIEKFQLAPSEKPSYDNEVYMPKAADNPVIAALKDRGLTKTSTDAKQLKILIDKLDPDIGYEEWYRIGMAIYHETNGSDEGLNIYDAWSSKGTKYSGTKEICAKWSSFKSGSSTPITVGTIYKLLADQNIHYCEDEFIECDYEIIENSEELNLLAKFSLRGQSAKLEAQISNASPVLGNLALKGQLSVWYAEFNSGKTLLAFHLAIQAIMEGHIDPSKLVYFNLDDSGAGLLDKLNLADEYGFEIIADGHNGFNSANFEPVLTDLLKQNQTNGLIIVLDTMKKIVDIMSKSDTTRLSKLLRRFSVQGGTFIGLAHTNKNKVGGKSQYGGTNDIMSDFDCGYVADVVSNEGGVKTVEFTNIKRRGNVPENKSFSYSNDSSLSYCQILASVQEVDPTQLVRLKQAELQKADEDIIASVKHFISQGINKKMALAKAVALDSQVSQKTAIGILERYNGKILHWSYSVGPKGAKIYSLT